MIHNIERVREQYRGLLDKMVEHGFAKVVCEAYCADDVHYEWSRQCDSDILDELDIWMSCGATRCCFGFNNDTEYVVKFQIDKDECDYCAREAQISRRAEQYGFGDYFAKCEPLFDYTFTYDNKNKKVEVYVMEWCCCDYDTVSDNSYNYHYTKFCEDNNLDASSDDSRDLFSDEEERRASDDENSESNIGMIEYAKSTWGIIDEKFLHDLIEFMRDWEINDLHAGNWGYKGDKLVMVDYGGYGDVAERHLYY